MCNGRMCNLSLPVFNGMLFRVLDIMKPLAGLLYHRADLEIGAALQSVIFAGHLEIVTNQTLMLEMMNVVTTTQRHIGSRSPSDINELLTVIRAEWHPHERPLGVVINAMLEPGQPLKTLTDQQVIAWAAHRSAAIDKELEAMLSSLEPPQ